MHSEPVGVNETETENLAATGGLVDSIEHQLKHQLNNNQDYYDV